MTTIHGVRAEPGGPVRLTLGPDGFSVTRHDPLIDLGVEHWLLIGMLGFLVLAGVSSPLGVRPLTVVLLVIAGLCLVALAGAMLLQAAVIVVGGAWLASRALTRSGRRQLRAGSRTLWRRIERQPGGMEYHVRADQVSSTEVDTGLTGTTVTLTMADGQRQRYSSWRSRTALAAAFGGHSA